MEEAKLNCQFATNSIIDGISIGVAILDKDLRIIAMNQALEALSGFSLEEAIGIPCEYIIRNNLCAKTCPAAQALESGKRTQAKGNIINKDRELVPVFVTASPLLDAQSETVGVIETIEDVSPKGDFNKQGPIAEYFDELIGHSLGMQKVKKVLPVIAATDSSILITGETGTGKDLVAYVIHRLSPRTQGAFIKVNCGALPEALLESELFGHVRGSFTGAVRDKPGRFQLAENGTIYLTEIGDLQLPLQVKLLTFLDDKEIIPVGGTRSIKTDVRVIAATHRNLEYMVGEGAFRDDLLYRLNVVRIDIPPLRDRGEDVRLLLEHFLVYFARKFEKNIEGFSKDTIFILKQYPYPGNVRELKNIVEYAASICPAGSILPSHLPEYLRDYKAGEPISAGPRAMNNIESISRNEKLSFGLADRGQNWNEIERRLITEALIQFGGNRTESAKKLGWGRSTLWRKMKKHGLT